MTITSKEVWEAYLEEIGKIRKREDLPKMERAISDTLDEHLMRIHGITTSWSHPSEFMRWLDKRGYRIVGVIK